METFPEPGPAAAAHGERVAAHVRGAIDAAGGMIGFDEFMEAVLYAPGLGYYSAGPHKLGEDGDFVTAPEISSLFGRCLARQFAQVHGAGVTTLMEVGAGSGRLAADLLLDCATLGVMPDRYLILEVSADLKDRQRRTLEALAPAFVDRVEWLDGLPEAFEGMVLANEVLDAMPVHRFRRTADGVDEITVTMNGPAFAWGTRPAAAKLHEAVVAVERGIGRRLPAGFVSEVNLRVGPWVRTLATKLARGALLFIDYGMSREEYYAAERDGGTLRCHYRHRAHDDPFLWPGLQDLTAQVDFTAVAEAGVAADLELAGYTTQAHFLIGCGIDELMAEPVADERGHWIRSQQAQRLMLPGEMGERFKAMGFTRGLDDALRGFSVRDLRDRL